jgi:hypothetical protein
MTDLDSEIVAALVSGLRLCAGAQVHDRPASEIRTGGDEIEFVFRPTQVLTIFYFATDQHL